MAAAPTFPFEHPPALESGDRLTREEFERRYEATPEKFKAELIEGVVYVASPVSLPHGDAQYDLIGWMTAYTALHPEIGGSDNATVRLDVDNEPQPDVLLRRKDGGTARVDGSYLAGPPELIAEIAASSVSIDLHAKLNAYRRNGVQEYIVWRVQDHEIDWFSLERGAYVRLAADERGVIHSKVFPGLRLAVAAMLAGDVAAVLAEQQHP
jgi:Uma2 family endonuclease